MDKVAKELIKIAKELISKKVVIEINNSDEKSIKQGEKKKEKLENDGYTLINEKATPFRSQLTYELKEEIKKAKALVEENPFGTSRDEMANVTCFAKYDDKWEFVDSERKKNYKEAVKAGEEWQKLNENEPHAYSVWAKDTLLAIKGGIGKDFVKKESTGTVNRLTKENI